MGHESPLADIEDGGAGLMTMRTWPALPGVECEVAGELKGTKAHSGLNCWRWLASVDRLFCTLRKKSKLKIIKSMMNSMMPSTMPDTWSALRDDWL